MRYGLLSFMILTLRAPFGRVIGSSDPFSAICALTGSRMSKDNWVQYLRDKPYQNVCP